MTEPFCVIYQTLRMPPGEPRAAVGQDRAAGTIPQAPPPVFGWFTEGFDAPNLKEAKALL
jgi:hypothetical protein